MTHLSIKEKLETKLISLGWKSVDDDFWQKGQLGKMKFLDAVDWELDWRVLGYDNIFVCPDCGYKVDFDEFVSDRING